jgi:hypothetical protein
VTLTTGEHISRNIAAPPPDDVRAAIAIARFKLKVLLHTETLGDFFFQPPDKSRWRRPKVSMAQC